VRRSVVLGVVLAVAGLRRLVSEKCFLTSTKKEAVPIVFEDHRITTERRVVERVASCTRSRARMASPGDLPDIGWL